MEKSKMNKKNKKLKVYLWSVLNQKAGNVMSHQMFFPLRRSPKIEGIGLKAASSRMKKKSGRLSDKVPDHWLRLATRSLSQNVLQGP